MEIVFLDSCTLGNVSMAPIREMGHLVSYRTSTREEALVRVADAEVLIVNKIFVDGRLLDAAPRLRLVCEAATGLVNIDLEAARSRGIEVRNVAGYSTDSVAQLTFSQILTLLTNPAAKDAFVKGGEYEASDIFTNVESTFPELAGKTIGIIGMGKIGQKVAKIASAFGMNVIYYSTSGTSHCTEYPSVPLDTLLSQSDIISIHCPLNDRTNGLIGESQLRKMKSDAIIVNMARGQVIDEQALADAISQGIIGGAAVDVYSAEPIAHDNPLLHTTHPEKILFTPHIAWASKEAVVRLVAGIADNISVFSRTCKFGDSGHGF